MAGDPGPRRSETDHPGKQALPHAERARCLGPLEGAPDQDCSKRGLHDEQYEGRAFEGQFGGEREGKEQRAREKTPREVPVRSAQEQERRGEGEDRSVGEPCLPPFAPGRSRFHVEALSAPLHLGAHGAVLAQGRNSYAMNLEP